MFEEGCITYRDLRVMLDSSGIGGDRTGEKFILGERGGAVSRESRFSFGGKRGAHFLTEQSEEGREERVESVDGKKPGRVHA
ncbi:hypothetical protein [Natronosalvus vescus]|uniref:hypothetical protein n=1 Tax=Natronosalvus vescus TaxID=2953881 RepID=UPI0020919E17|nr:hypothetical protein [Natronosalvus vescus]